MAEALKRASSGHLGTITRTENSVKEILEKEPSTLTLLEISKVKCSLERCKEQVSKIEELNERIINELTESGTISEEIEAEMSRIEDNDLRIKTTIKALETAEERIEQAAYAAPTQPQTVTEDNQLTSTSGLKLPKLSLPLFTGKYSEWTPSGWPLCPQIWGHPQMPPNCPQHNFNPQINVSLNFLMFSGSDGWRLQVYEQLKREVCLGTAHSGT